MSVNVFLYNINNYMDIKLVDFSPSKVKNSLLISLNLYHVTIYSRLMFPLINDTIKSFLVVFLLLIGFASRLILFSAVRLPLNTYIMLCLFNLIQIQLRSCLSIALCFHNCFNRLTHSSNPIPICCFSPPPTIISQ